MKIFTEPHNIDRLLRLEALGRLFYGSPLAPDQLEIVTMAGGKKARAIRPAIPTGWDFERREFVNHATDHPVVCAGLLLRMALLRGLGHPSHHPELSRMEQCHGWLDDVAVSGKLIRSDPYLCTTNEIHHAIRQKGAALHAWIYDLGEPAEPFRPFPLQTHQYRSLSPIEPCGAYKITGLDWPTEIAVTKPYDQYATEDQWRSDIIRQFRQSESQTHPQ